MQPLHANSQTEARLYLKVTPCPACHSGPREVVERSPVGGEGADAGGERVLAVCQHCRVRTEFLFHYHRSAVTPPPGEGGHGDDAPGGALPVEPVNPTDRPSRIIDLAQWLSLFHLSLDSAGRSPGRAARRQAFQSAQCLDEALKFYTEDNELPPATAFFTPGSRQAFADHPERFTRQRLRDLRAKLPASVARLRRLAHEGPAAGADQAAPARRWWRFWKG